VEEVVPDYGGATGALFPVGGGAVSTLQHVTFEDGTFCVDPHPTDRANEIERGRIHAVSSGRSHNADGIGAVGAEQLPLTDDARAQAEPRAASEASEAVGEVDGTT
jgi:hypothetical protein